jgi:hypothetical protein
MVSSRCPTRLHYRIITVTTMKRRQNLLVGCPLLSPRTLSTDKTLLMVARYQQSMLRSLKEVQGDDNVVGFYQATSLGAFFNQSLIDTQAIHQDRLRHGGVVVVHGNVTWLGMQTPPANNEFRHLTDGTRKCVIPCIQANARIHGCLQKS